MVTFSRLLSLVAAVTFVVAVCPAERPLRFCCLNVAPFSTNSGVWGGICGATDVAPTTLIGARCTSLTTCPTGTQLTCCQRFVPGLSGQCSLGVDCGGEAPTVPSSSVVPTPSAEPEPPLPPGWQKIHNPSTCYVDNGPRVLENVITTTHSDLTPYSCAVHCQSQGFRFSGVEYEAECHCGTGFKGSENRPASECDMKCTGDPTWTCGGSWRIQLYVHPDPL